MIGKFPNDSDGDALRKLVEAGSDLTKEMEIDFTVDVPDREKGSAFAAEAELIGFRVEVDLDEPTGSWTCYCSRRMIPSYEEIISIQKSLEDIGKPYNAKPDGWGSFGNAVD